MTVSDDDKGGMRYDLDDALVDRLFDGELAPHDAPPELFEIAALVQAARSPATADEQRGAPSEPRAPAVLRRHRRTTRVVTTKVVVATAAIAVASAAAALPARTQQAPVEIPAQRIAAVVQRSSSPSPISISAPAVATAETGVPVPDGPLGPPGSAPSRCHGAPG